MGKIVDELYSTYYSRHIHHQMLNALLSWNAYALLEQNHGKLFFLNFINFV